MGNLMRTWTRCSLVDQISLLQQQHSLYPYVIRSIFYSQIHALLRAGLRNQTSHLQPGTSMRSILKPKRIPDNLTPAWLSESNRATIALQDAHGGQHEALPGPVSGLTFRTGHVLNATADGCSGMAQNSARRGGRQRSRAFVVRIQVAARDGLASHWHHLGAQTNCTHRPAP